MAAKIFWRGSEKKKTGYVAGHRKSGENLDSESGSETTKSSDNLANYGSSGKRSSKESERFLNIEMTSTKTWRGLPAATEKKRTGVSKNRTQRNRRIKSMGSQIVKAQCESHLKSDLGW